MKPSDDKQRLRELLLERSVSRGDFVLASGRRSSFYIDARRTTMSAEGLVLIGALGLTRLHARDWRPQTIGGLTLGADPVAYAVALAARTHGVALDAFTVRKQAKTHGTGRRIEGCFAPQSRVVVVEDVITTGCSAYWPSSTAKRVAARRWSRPATASKCSSPSPSWDSPPLPERALARRPSAV
jgi:orotate phosphoribosyltransferase